MSIESKRETDGASARPSNASEMLDSVFRDLVQIHAAMAERTSGDREIKGWAQRELMDVIRGITAFRRAQTPSRD
jgi:hypothetical protein